MSYTGHQGVIGPRGMFDIDERFIVKHDYKWRCICPKCGKPLKPSTPSSKFSPYWYCENRDCYTMCLSEIYEYAHMRVLEQRDFTNPQLLSVIDLDKWLRE